MPVAALCCNKYSDNVLELCSNRCWERQTSVGKFPFCAALDTEPLLQNIQVVHNWEKSQQGKKKKKSKNPIKRNKHNKKSCWQGMKRRIPLTFYPVLQYKLISA